MWLLVLLGCIYNCMCNSNLLMIPCHVILRLSICLLDVMGSILGEGPLPLGGASPASDSHIHMDLSHISFR